MVMRSLPNYFSLLAGVWGKRVIKWFCKLSDTYQEVREGHKQEGAECASCWPAVLYRADSLYHHSWHTHSCRNTHANEEAGMFFHWNQGEAGRQERQTVRVDNIETVCPRAQLQTEEHESEASSSEEIILIPSSLLTLIKFSLNCSYLSHVTSFQ